MRRMPPVQRLLCRAAAAVLSAALLVAPGSSVSAQRGAPPPLGGVARLKSWFNANRSHVKAILLLSPT